MPIQSQSVQSPPDQRLSGPGQTVQSIQRNLWLFVLCQALTMSMPSFVVFAGGIVGLIALGLAAFVAVIAVVFARFDFLHYWVALPLLALAVLAVFNGRLRPGVRRLADST